MSTATREVSVCSWLRKRFNEEYPIVFVYEKENFSNNGIILGDNGYFNWFVGTHLKIESKFNVPHGEWFHVCWVWSYLTQTTKVYLNGKHVGSARTNQRELATEGSILLGNRGDFESNIFGGDMYKLNVFNRVLLGSVIRKMASDICSDEEKLTANRMIKWEDIVSKERTGWVTEVPIESQCGPQTVAQSDIIERVRLLEEEKSAVEETLKEHSERLTRIENALSHTLGDVMNRILLRLANIEDALEGNEGGPSTEN